MMCMATSPVAEIEWTVSECSHGLQLVKGIIFLCRIHGEKKNYIVFQTVSALAKHAG